MELDPKLILTHIVGFVIMVLILKRYAWKPLLAILEERRNKIKSEFDHIEKEKTEVSEIRADYEAQLKDIDKISRQKLNEAVGEGQKIAADIKEQGRVEAKEIIERAKAELERDVEKARAQLKEDMVTITLAAAEKVIRSRLDETEHRRMINDFIDGVEKA